MFLVVSFIENVRTNTHMFFCVEERCVFLLLELLFMLASNAVNVTNHFSLAAVGKSAILTRFSENAFLNNYSSTIGTFIFLVSHISIVP